MIQKFYNRKGSFCLQEQFEQSVQDAHWHDPEVLQSQGFILLFFVGPYTNLSFESDKNHKRKVNLYNLHFADGTSFLHSKLCCLHSTLVLCTALRVGTSFYCFEFFYNNENFKLSRANVSLVLFVRVKLCSVLYRQLQASEGGRCSLTECTRNTACRVHSSLVACAKR